MRKRYFLIPAGIIFAWATWVGLVLRTAGNPLVGSRETSNPFLTLGTFGDSFGAIASLMATLAAAGALLAFSHQRQSQEAQQFESNFFTLLGHFQQIVDQLDVQSFRKRVRGPQSPPTDVEIIRTYTGRDALRQILSLLRKNICESDFADTKLVCDKYEKFYTKWSDDLGHYFRLLYHIVRLVHENCPGDTKYYMRLIRAHLSDSELVLLAYNSICGEGRDRFVDYVSEYSLLHNLHRNDLDHFLHAELGFFTRKIPEPAFRFPVLTPPTYDDRVPKVLPKRKVSRRSLI
jgi:Putative phage abortive infection protein